MVATVQWIQAQDSKGCVHGLRALDCLDPPNLSKLLVDRILHIHHLSRESMMFTTGVQLWPHFEHMSCQADEGPTLRGP